MKTTSLFINIALLFLSFDFLFSQLPPDSIQLNAWNNFKEKNQGTWRIRWDEKTVTPTSIYFGKTKAYLGSPEQIAKTFLKENAALIKMRSDISDLKVIGVMSHHNINDVKLHQTKRDI
jgi:hypothetical protein